ncbi:gluconokinase [Antrihabitans sp. YC3-6]|uniref:Gluconokinase n=1 Tax=Antrihabitans stalagmiti TaxID=2799499 RepID=A0A934NS29_9NOCA|nr:gluconokinase [Antrihabitans stalagmiti]MBJ8340279.1 gluconokinase [Antrihabitans stalagmiti]
MTVLVVMGVSGTGKSTVATALAEHFGWQLQEGDDLHPKANIAKMAGGQPLDDNDRWPWLQLIADWIGAHIDSGTSGIVTCSALKRTYRDVLRRDGVVFVYLEGSEELLRGRMESRTGHFMPASLLTSQLHTLEPPQSDEAAITVDIDQTEDELTAAIIEQLVPLIEVPDVPS